MRLSLLTLFLLFTASAAWAQPASLDYGEDFTFDDEVHHIATVKVAPNRIEHYLAGLQQTWAVGQQIAVDMGVQHDYTIYVSEMENGGDFNVMLVSIYEDHAQRIRANDPATATAIREAMEARMSESQLFQTTEFYTGIREIVGDYLVREVDFE